MTTFISATAAKKDKIIYWIFTTIFFLLDGLIPALTFNSEMAKQGIRHTGLPEWFRLELSYGKIIGGLLLIIPFIPPRYKEWAYVGYGISIISAYIANAAVDGISPMLLFPVVAFAILLISYVYFHKIKAEKI